MNVLQADAIVNIPENRIRYFGRTGKMLLPCPATIAAVIQQVPEKKLLTTDLLRNYLTNQFQVEGTCPVTTRKSLVAVAQNQPDDVAYWRIINQNGALIGSFPGGVDAQAALLKQEGIAVDATGKVPKVVKFREKLAQFA
jgi:hypothetical protein